MTATVNWLMGEEHLDPAWTFGADGERFEVEITGDPSCLTTFKKLHPETVEAGLVRNPGVVATAMHCVNAIPYVCPAEPGLRTYLEMPLVAGRAALALHRDRRGASKSAGHDPRPLRISGRVAVVTGAGLGIGRGIAIGLAEAGADVVLAARTVADLEEVAGHIQGLGRRALVVPTDVTDAVACERLVDADSRGVRPARHPGQQRGRGDAPGGHGHQRGVHGPDVRLQRHRSADPHQAGRPPDGRHRRSRGGRQHLVALGQHDPDDVRGLRRRQGGTRPDDPQHRARAGAPGAGQRH